MEAQIIQGPVAESNGVIIYEITLSSGMIVTDPSAFGRSPEAAREIVPAPTIVTEDGRVLVLGE